MACTGKEKPVGYRHKSKAVGEGVEEESRGDVGAGAEQEVSTVEVDYRWDHSGFNGPGPGGTCSTGLRIPRCLRAALGF